MTRTYNIPKQLLMRAYKLVKANAGSAGVDKQSLQDFEKNLEGLHIKDLLLQASTFQGWLSRRDIEHFYQMDSHLQFEPRCLRAIDL